MKVVTNVVKTSPGGGVEMNVFQVSRELARRQHEVDLMYVEAGPLLREYEVFCRHIRHVPSVDYGFPLGRRGKAKQALEQIPAVLDTVRSRPDVIYANRVFSAGWAVPAATICHAPIVSHLHGHTDVGPEVINWLNRKIGRFVIISEFVAQQWINSGLDPAKIAIVYNGIDPAEYPVGRVVERLASREALGLPETAYVVTYFGRVDAEKGIEVLLSAWASFGLDRDDGHLLVVGSSMPNSANYAAQLHAMASSNVSFIAAQRDVVPYLHAADVVVIPSTWDEPFGRVVIEALSTGRPVLASRVGAIPEILTGELESFLFDRGDDVELCELLERFRGWEKRDPDLGARCRERVLQEFTLDKAVDGIEAAFQALV